MGDFLTIAIGKLKVVRCFSTGNKKITSADCVVFTFLEKEMRKERTRQRKRESKKVRFMNVL